MILDVADSLESTESLDSFVRRVLFEPDRPLTEAAKEKLTVVKRMILAEPDRVDMTSWVVDPCAIGMMSELGLRAPACGTVACIAGFVLYSGGVAAHDVDYFEVEGLACDALGLSPVQGARLFYVVGWPSDLHAALSKAERQSRGYAEVVARRIDRFVLTDGRE